MMVVTLLAVAVILCTVFVEVRGACNYATSVCTDSGCASNFGMSSTDVSCPNGPSSCQSFVRCMSSCTVANQILCLGVVKSVSCTSQAACPLYFSYLNNACVITSSSTFQICAFGGAPTSKPTSKPSPPPSAKPTSLPTTPFPTQSWYQVQPLSSSTCYACLHRTSWLLNEGHVSTHWPTLTDILSSRPDAYDGTATKWVVSYTGIIKYDHTMSASDVVWLNAMASGTYEWKNNIGTTAVAGQVVSFGDDIGYNSPETFDPRGLMSGCGMGYWPQGPPCPGGQTSTSLNVYQRSLSFPLVPAPEANRGGSTGDGCYLGTGAVGLWVNGAEIYGWSDGFTYNNLAVWQRVGPVDEIYDMDICFGHAAP